jgi:hypothetical protein
MLAKSLKYCQHKAECRNCKHKGSVSHAEFGLNSRHQPQNLSMRTIKLECQFWLDETQRLTTINKWLSIKFAPRLQQNYLSLLKT